VRLAAFVVNAPRARNLSALRARCATQATARGWDEPLWLPTTAADTGHEMTRHAVAAGAALVVAVGGDGTVRACAQELAGTGVPLAIVPAGTANLVGRALGLPRDIGQALSVGFGGADRPVDIAMLDDGTVSMAMTGIGLDAAVVGGTPAVLKRRFGWPGYAVASLPHVLAAPTRFVVRLDGQPELLRLARSVVVGNCGLLPGGFPLLPAARPDDGVLDVGILAPAALADWVLVGYRAITGSGRDDRRLERFQARRVEIRAESVLPRQADGEMLDSGHALAVEVRPGALLVRVPR
jgi:diacylglycerol kinase family enzyme